MAAKRSLTSAAEDIGAALNEKICLGKITVENVVATASTGRPIDLEKLATGCLSTMYEPEQFPGVIYRPSEGKTAVLIFASGNLVITGIKSESEADRIAVETFKMLRSSKLFD